MAQQLGIDSRRDEIEQALERVLAAHAFRSSAQCQALLRYIVEHSLSQENEMLRERIIGIKVFGRAPDYDAGNDPIVRARAAEVRKRLAQHYMNGEGAAEALRIEIPSGSYRAIFAEIEKSETIENLSHSEPETVVQSSAKRNTSETHDALAHGAGNAEDPVSPERVKQRRGDRRRELAVLISIVAVMAGLAFLAGRLATAHRTPAQRDVQGFEEPVSASDPVGSFWAPFIKEDRSPIIAYADAMFLIDGSGDLIRFRRGAIDNRGASVDSHLARQYAANPGLASSAGPLFYDNGYTGTGDLRAMAMLMSQLARQGATPLVESSYDISTDDLRQHNVILLGSSAENLAVAQLVPAGDFLFEGPTSIRDPWSDQIVNTRPRPGEQSKYATVRDSATHVLQEDYAVVSFQPSISPDHQIAILGGIDTTGTEGAAEMVTTKAGIEELTNALSQGSAITESSRSRSFQALVRVDVKKGYQVLGARLVTVHPFSEPKPAGER